MATNYSARNLLLGGGPRTAYPDGEPRALVGHPMNAWDANAQTSSLVLAPLRFQVRPSPHWATRATDPALFDEVTFTRQDSEGDLVGLSLYRVELTYRTSGAGVDGVVRIDCPAGAGFLDVACSGAVSGASSDGWASAVASFIAIPRGAVATITARVTAPGTLWLYGLGIYFDH